MASRIQAKVSGGISCSPILMNSHVLLQMRHASHHTTMTRSPTVIGGGAAGPSPDRCSAAV